MAKRTDLGTLIKGQLLPEYRLRALDTGSDAKLSAKRLTFFTDTYEVEGIGHLCVMSMKAMGGLMKMETVVLSPFYRDIPLLNLDWVSAFGKETQIIELYDTQLEPDSQDMLDEFAAIRDRDSELPEYVPKGTHSYDSIKYAESYQKTGKSISGRFSEAAQDYIRVYVKQLRVAAKCDGAQKGEKIRAFTDMLISDGGVAVDQMTKLFGQETAERVVREHLYGV